MQGASRTSLVVVGACAVLALAGCSGDAATAEATADASEASGGYADGTYSAEGSYQTPESVESVTVTVTLDSGVITDLEVVGNARSRESEQYQEQFIGGVAEEVVGQNIDDVSVDRVAGSSLTSGGFMQALDQISADAAE